MEDRLAFLEILDICQEYLILLNEKCEIVFINQAFSSRFLKAQDDQTLQSYEDIHHLFFQDDKQINKKDILKVKTEGAFSFTVRLSDGALSTQYLEFSVNYLTKSKIFLLSGVNKTDQLALENLIRLLPGYLYWKDQNGVYQACNDYMAKELGFKSREDIIGKTDYELWPDQADNIRENDLEVMTTGKALKAEEEVVFRDKTKEYYYAIKSPWRNSQGQIEGILGNSLNITALKNAQYALEEEKLKAENASKAKSDFLAVMSHELRTPLTSIIGMIEILINQNHLRDKLDYLAKIDTTSKHLLAIINNILDFSKLNEAKFVLMHEPFNLRDIFKQSFDIIKPKADEKKLYLTLRYPENVPSHFLGDAQALLQILINLMGNAVKFTERGGVSVKITQKSDKQGHAIIDISIADTGIGIPANKIDHIFNRFEQLGYAKTGINRGTGLGLNVSQKLVTLMGSKITVESTPNQGSIFSMRLRLEYDRLKVSQNNLEDEVVKPVHKHYHLLLVEDDLLIQMLHKQKFVSYGFKVEIASTGKEALSLCKKKKFDIIFMDIGLPDLEGSAIIKIIRSSKKYNTKTPIVALTAYSDENNKIAAISAGANEALSKPTNNTTLNEVFARYL